jgi:small conductance mechanosensitive channel
MDTSTEQLIETTLTLVSTWGLQVIGAIAVLIVGRWIAGLLRRAVTRGLERARVDATLVPFLAGMTYYLALAVVLIAVLGLFGIETTSLVAVVGAAGLAVGLAMQGTLANFSSGVMLLVFRPFGKGDFVEVAGVKGSVQQIGIFTTTLSTPDNVCIIVPNSAVSGAIISNYSANDTRRNDMVFGVSYVDDLANAEDAIRRVLAADSRVLKDPEPVVAVAELADSSVNFVVRPWCGKDDYWPLRFDLTRRIKDELESSGCSIPFPQRDLHIVNGAGGTP